MRTADWARSLAGSDAFQAILRQTEGASEWHSVAAEARPVLFAAAYHAHPRKSLIVTSTYEKALQWQARLGLCGLPSERLFHLPSGGASLFEDAAPEHIALSDRLGALRALIDEGPTVVIATPQAALERTLPADVLKDAFLNLTKGTTVDLESVERQLTNLGYEHQEPVRLPGQFSRRGGILDLFASGHELPFRIELFGDEIESIRLFDPNSQRSIRTVSELRIAPSRETLYSGGEADLRELLLDSMQREASTLDDESSARLIELVTSDANALAERIYFDRLDLYRPLLHPDSPCALDLVGEDGIVVLEEPLEMDGIVARAEDELAQALAARAERGEILHSTVLDFMLPPEHMANSGRRLVLTAMNAVPDWLSSDHRIDIGASSLEPYRGRGEALAHTLSNWRSQGTRLVFATDQPTRAKSILAQIEIHPTTPEQAPAKHADLSDAVLVSGNLGGGFVAPAMNLAVLTDAELFGVARLRMPQRRFMEGAPVATVLDLKPGDYVVHIHFGIGVFRGLVSREEHGIQKEYLYIEYEAPDKLYVPADQLDRIQKYLNPTDEHPKLNRLRGQEWQKTLAKAKEDAREFARDLVKLYAKRRAVRRRPFGSDTPWQSELEATFPWVETPSQLQAIRDTKQDMADEFPMDRLVCGDVGFGKTEVAIRAAFKAVQAGRQVAVLCPTTILSEQHYRTFRERLDPFGVHIELANRFRTAAQRDEIGLGLSKGDVDIVIGTHTLLGKNIQFKDLGLVVIDEEQRFGVKQKEMLKHLRAEVDVLTLSATPIPRTLSMALMDIRQMSLINDPPPGRLPIRTFLRPYSKEVLREAILRELSRGGQVFYVYNRVESITHVADKVRRLVPTARIAVGHGQMTEKQLEPVMVAFIEGEVDVLVSTTIVESGLDIPNANTLIVEDADRLGLAQLYQLRGRVGRSDRQAYAYLLYSSGKELTENAMSRLQALQEFSQLGSGYSLAFRDLQIRGAGDLLGAKQHGSMASVGYELYTQLINEAVQMLKNSVDGEEAQAQVKDPLESAAPLPAFEASVVALLPDTYIKDQAQRLYYYQKMMAARAEEALGEAQAEIEDRYGHPPIEVRNAFAIMVLRMRAKRLGIEKMEAAGGRLSLSFRDIANIPSRVFTLANRRNRECYISRDFFIWPFSGDAISATQRMLDSLESAWAEHEQALASLDAR